MNTVRTLLTAALAVAALAVPSHASARPAPLDPPTRLTRIRSHHSHRWPHRPTVLGPSHLAKPAKRTEPRPDRRNELTSQDRGVAGFRNSAASCPAGRPSQRGGPAHAHRRDHLHR
jgi:hypothetical protein